MASPMAGPEDGPAPPPGLPEVPDVPGAPDVPELIEALRAQGAQRLDPLRFRLIEALARRAAGRDGATRQHLDARLHALLAAQAARVAAARSVAEDSAAALAARHPQAAATAQALLRAGDLAGLRRLAADLDGGQRRRAITGLLDQLARPAAGAEADAAGGAHTAAGPASGPDAAARTAAPAELKALRDFRSTWARLSVEQRLARSLAQAPEKAGPLNSHGLALRALQAMRDLSPDYLQRYVGYVDALLWLEQAKAGAAAEAADGAPAPAERRRRPARGRAG